MIHLSLFCKKLFKNLDIHCVKSVRIRSYSGPYSVRMLENTDQSNSEYEHFSRSDCSKTTAFLRNLVSLMCLKPTKMAQNAAIIKRYHPCYYVFYCINYIVGMSGISLITI